MKIYTKKTNEKFQNTCFVVQTRQLLGGLDNDGAIQLFAACFLW
jgi:hypothetical protein